MGKVWKRPEPGGAQSQNGAAHAQGDGAASTSKLAAQLSHPSGSVHARPQTPMRPHVPAHGAHPGPPKQFRPAFHETAANNGAITGASASQQPPLKRQRIEARQHTHTAAPAAPAARQHPAVQVAPQGASTSAQPPTAQKPARQGAAKAQPGAAATLPPVTLEQQLKSKAAEMEDLRRKLQEKEQLVAKQKELQAAQEAARLAQQQQQAEMLKKKEQLSKGFKLTSAVAAEALAAAAAAMPSSTGASTGSGTSGSFVADELEVARVLHSKSDYDCLKLHPGAGLAQIRKSYRALAVALHPDKCKLEGAADAFQRLNKAYTSLCKHSA